MTDTAETPPGPDDSPVLLAMRTLEERLTAAVRREEEVDFEGQRAARVTRVISRTGQTISVLLTPLIFYLIFSLIQSMGIITDRMGVMAQKVAGMRGNFDETTGRMATIDQSVNRMAGDVSYMPGMEKTMQGMRTDFSAMTSSMNGIAPDMQSIDSTLAGMDWDVAQMNLVFSHMNGSVFSIGHDVNTMSSPMRMFPFFGN